MRLIVIGLIVLAGLKIWTQDRIMRDVMGDALIAAYRDRARDVCQRQPAKAARTPQAAPASTWGADAAATIEIGNPAIDVAIWDTENPLWESRFRHPHLVLTSHGQPAIHCAYDVVAGVATLSIL